MSTRTEAHRLANLAAAQAHGDLGIDPASFPVDVYGAIGDADVMLIWRPLPRLTRHQRQIQPSHPLGAQPLPAGPHLLPSELTRAVLVQRVAGYQGMLARHRTGPIEIEQVDVVAVDQVHERADHHDHAEPGPRA